jgi:16S rRNA (guanine527-N7)-methyltransferase
VDTAVHPAARRVFGDRFPLAERYAERLTTDGVVRGLIGPREAPRIWERHLLNSAVVAELVPEDATVIDLGSGAGLPGIPLALARPDLTVTLLEPTQRRVAFLTEVVAELGLARVDVLTARAEDVAGEVTARVVTARAVAPLDRLARWALPLASPGGVLLAMKGTGARSEADEHAAAIRRAGGGKPEVRHCGVDLVDPPATVVVVHRSR